MTKYSIIFVFMSFLVDSQENAQSHVEWTKAKPFESIPGPGVWTLLKRFLPGGKGHFMFKMSFFAVFRRILKISVKFHCIR